MKERLTIHIQAIVSDPLLPAERRVRRLAAQRRPVVFPFHGDPDGAGHAERLGVVLLGYHTWREEDRMRRWRARRQLEWQRNKQAAKTCLRPPAAASHLWWRGRGREGGREGKETFRREDVAGRSEQTEMGQS